MVRFMDRILGQELWLSHPGKNTSLAAALQKGPMLLWV